MEKIQKVQVQGFSSVVLKPALQVQCPEFYSQYPPPKQQQQQKNNNKKKKKEKKKAQVVRALPGLSDVESALWEPQNGGRGSVEAGGGTEADSGTLLPVRGRKYHLPEGHREHG